MADIARITDELLEKELLSLVDDLKKRHIELGQKATGNWIDSLEVVVSNGRGLIYGTDYTEYLTKGRPKGNKPPINPIKEWAKVKLGLGDKEALNAAFAIAIKIGKEGTEIHKQGGTDLIESVITDQRIQEMYNNIQKELIPVIAENLLRVA